MFPLFRTIVKSNNFDKLLPVEEHFRLSYHDFSIDAKFTIMEKIEKAPIEKITSILESHQDKWTIHKPPYTIYATG